MKEKKNHGNGSTQRRLGLLLAVSSCLAFLAGCQPGEKDDLQERQNELLQTYDRQFQEYLSRAQQEMGKEILRYSPVSAAVTIPKRMDVTGSHYDYGRLVGRIAQLYNRSPRRVAEYNRKLNEGILEMYGRVCPQYLQLARGLGEVFGIPLEELDFTYLEYDFFIGLWYSLFRYNEFQGLAGTHTASVPQTATHCSILSAKIGEDVFIGRNFDQDHEKPHFVEFSRMEGAYKVLANTCYIPYHWIMDGVNEKGLFMGTANLMTPAKYYWTDLYPDVPAVCEHHLFRIALETCATVDEVIALYRRVRPWSPNGTDHVLVADAQGNSAVIEFNLEREPVFFPSEKSYQVMTNIAYQEGFAYMQSNCSRFARATSLAESGIHSFADVERITREIRLDHGYTSFFDLRRRFMQLFRRLDYDKGYDFTLTD